MIAARSSAHKSPSFGAISSLSSGGDSTYPGVSINGATSNYEEDFIPFPLPDGDLMPIFGNPLVQNWGQVAKVLKLIFPHPGTSCNPKKSAGSA
jgi:hypothetical protein